MSKVYPKDFIEEYLKKQIGQIIEENHPYLAFSLISSLQTVFRGRLMWINYNTHTANRVGGCLRKPVASTPLTVLSVPTGTERFTP